MERKEAQVAANALLPIWEYAAEIQHKVPADEAFRLLFKRIDEDWVSAYRIANGK